MYYPTLTTKRADVTETFDLHSPAGRRAYYQAKAGPTIEAIKTYLETGTFVAFLLARKAAGKGTYAQALVETLGSDRVYHLSVGDLVREIEQLVKDPAAEATLRENLQNTYRGFLPFEDAYQAFVNRDNSVLIPDEFILAVIKWKIAQMPNKAVLIDGFPRSIDQITYALYFREIMNLREDPDFFMFFDVPIQGIDERIKYRVACPDCQLSRNLRFNISSLLGYDTETDQYHLICDNGECSGHGETRMVGKEGDHKGIDHIRGRIETETALMEKANELQGVPKVLASAFVPTDVALDNVDTYEISTAYDFSHDDAGNVSAEGGYWELKNDAGESVYGIKPPALVLSILQQVHEILGLNQR